MGRREILARLSGFIAGWMAGTLCTALVGILVMLLVSLMTILAGWGSFSAGLGLIVFFELTARTGTVLWAVESGPGMVLFSQIVGVLNGLVATNFPRRLVAPVKL